MMMMMMVITIAIIAMEIAVEIQIESHFLCWQPQCRCPQRHHLFVVAALFVCEPAYSGHRKEDIILHTLYVEFAPPMLALRLCRICVYASIHSIPLVGGLAFSRQSQQTMGPLLASALQSWAPNPLHGARIWRLSTWSRSKQIARNRLAMLRNFRSMTSIFVPTYPC